MAVICINNYPFDLTHSHHVLTQVLGVKGPTVLALLPSFDLVWGVVIDDLHGIFLGVTLTLLHLWFDKANKTKLFFIGNKVMYNYISVYILFNSHHSRSIFYEQLIHIILQVKQCDERLLTIQVTDSMSRVPRSLEDFKHWKGIYTSIILPISLIHVALIFISRCRIAKLAPIFFCSSSTWYIAEPVSQSLGTIGWCNIPVFITMHFLPRASAWSTPPGTILRAI